MNFFNKKLIKLFTFLIFLFPSNTQGQEDTISTISKSFHEFSSKKYFSLVTGYYHQKNRFAEFGIGILEIGKMGYHPYSNAFSISNEIIFSEDFVWGFKATTWFSGGSSPFNIGLNIINYTDFKSSALRFRPEIGIGVFNFRIVYGLNVTITNDNFENINRHNFGVNVLFKLKEKKKKI